MTWPPSSGSESTTRDPEPAEARVVGGVEAAGAGADDQQVGLDVRHLSILGFHRVSMFDTSQPWPVFVMVTRVRYGSRTGSPPRSLTKESR